MTFTEETGDHGEYKEFDIDETEGVCKGATEEPWEVYHTLDGFGDPVFYVGHPHVAGSTVICEGEATTSYQLAKGNAEFIAHARTALPAACRKIRELERKNAAVDHLSGKLETTVDRLIKEHSELKDRHAKTVAEIEAVRSGLYEKMASEDIKGRFLDPIEIQAYKMCISDMIYEFKRRFPRNG